MRKLQHILSKKMFTRSIALLITVGLIASQRSVLFAQTSDTRTCIRTESYNRITDEQGLIKMALSQSNDLNSTTNYIMEEDNDSTENGLTAIQLLNEDYYSDGSIEKEYVVDNFALEDRATGDISYTSSTTSYNTTKYNIAARQTLYFTCKYYGSGVPVYDDIFVHATKVESYVNFSSTSVAFFQHGIIAQLFMNSAYPDIYNIETVGTPVNNKSYYVYANESNYYKLYGAGQYASIMSVRTANNNEFELQIDVLSILDGL